MMHEVIQVTTTTDSQQAASAIAQELVEQRLAACAQVSGPLSSVYHWEGKIETSQEWVCSAKTLRDNFPQVESAIQRLHSYDEPQIVATAVVAGSEGYLNWVARECR